MKIYNTLTRKKEELDAAILQKTKKKQELETDIATFEEQVAAKIKKSFAVFTFLLFTVATLFEDYIRYYFADNFYYNAINKNGEAFGYYLATVIAVAVEGAIFVLLYVAIARALRFVVSEHTGYVVGREIESEGEKKQILAVQNRLNKNFSSLIDFAVLCALADTFASLYGAFYAFLNKNFGWMTLLSLIFALLSTMQGLLPPSSSTAGVRCSAARLKTSLPTD